MRWKPLICTLTVAASLAGASGAWAGATDTLMDLLVQKGIITDQERKQLQEEMERDITRAMERQNKTKVASWLDQVKWSSDFRLRAEYFDNEDQSNTADRWRFRYRLRLGLEAKFVDWATIGFRLASGSEDPVSTNQSFQDTFSRKPVNIDLAYVTLQPPGWDWVAVSGGKIKQAIWQPDFLSPMQYDGDVTPEGIAEQFNVKFGDKNQYKFFANFGQYVLDELSSDSNDPFLLDFQGGLEARFGEDPKKPVVQVNAAGGFMYTQNVDMMGPVSGNQPAGAASPTSQSTSPNRGNATQQPGGAGTTLFYLDDFETLYGRGEVAWKLCDRPFLGTPAVLTFSGEYLMNLANAYDSLSGVTAGVGNPDQTEGYTGQIKFGQAKKQREWEVAYQYKYLEADAVWDALTDSDWGLGGTDRKGHVIAGAYNVRDWWQLGIKAFITEKISSRPNNTNNTRGTGVDDLLRVQMDSVFKF